jgi:hypothetical protein
MSDNYELVGSIRRSLQDIRDHWDAMLTPTGGSGRPGSATARITLEDHDERETDIDRSTRIVSLRREVVDVLNAISRWVAEDRPVTKALPNGTDALDMIGFVDRHAEWIADLDAEDNGYEAGRLRDLSKRVTSLVAPPRKEWHYMGDCPFVPDFDEPLDMHIVTENPPWFCTGRVRVPVGGEQSAATCTDCGRVGPVRWWEEVLGVPDEVVDAEEMARRIFDSLHIRVTGRTVRNWVRGGRISPFVPFGPQPLNPPWRFLARSVLDEVARMDRDCPKCGRIWSGEGDVCPACWYAMQSAVPRKAEPKRHTPAPISLRPRHEVPDSHDTDRPDRCHYSDLPIDQCACGHEHAKQPA